MLVAGMSMLTLVQIRNANASSADTASLVADYLAFERRRVSTRQYLKAFGGMALLVLAGALTGRVSAREAAVVSGLLLTPPLLLAAVEYLQWRRLLNRLDCLRSAVRNAESRKKAVRTAVARGSGT